MSLEVDVDLARGSFRLAARFTAPSGLTALFGLMGYVFYKLGCEPAPLILGFILGPLMEENLRRALLLSRGDPLVFVQRPISLVLLLMAVALLLLVILPNFRKTREEAFKEV